MFGFTKNRQRTAFWLLGPEGLAVAVLEPTTDEPLLLACAQLSTRPSGGPDDFAPGLLEAAAAVRALDLAHVAALDRTYCRLEPASAPRSREASAADLTVPVVGSPDLCAVAPKQVVLGAMRRFEGARLKLAALDAAPCALMNLAAHLARALPAAASGDVCDDADFDALTAVSVAPECEQDAGRLAASLAVPVGLALARFGLVENG